MPSDSSPTKFIWANPEKLLKIRRRRKKQVENDDETPTPKLSSAKSESKKATTSATNPFKMDSQSVSGLKKRVRPNPPVFDYCVTEPPPNVFSAWRTLNKLEDEEEAEFTRVDIGPLDFSCLLRGEGKSPVARLPSTAPKFEELSGRPIDLSLATRVRITSNSPFPWQTMTTAESSIDVCTGQSWFVTDAQFDRSSAKSDPNYQSAWLQKSSHLYSYPNISWLNNFPRKKSLGGLRPSESFLPTMSTMSETVRELVKSQWYQTLQQLFQTLRSGHTPMFYFCCRSFTVLFMRGGSGDELRAMLTPTTDGFRHALTADGVDFTMVKKGNELKFGAPPPQPTSFSLMDFTGAADEGKASDDTDVDWLDRFKMSPRFIQKLEHFKKFGTDTSESAVVTMSTEATVALYNFLLNTPLCWANTGTQAGMPPTLLSPRPFRNSSLERLKINYSVVKQGGCAQHQLDLVGAVMPHNVYSLMSLLEATLNQFNVTLTGSQEYEVFNQFGTAISSLSASESFSQALHKCRRFAPNGDLQWVSDAYRVPL